MKSAICSLFLQPEFMEIFLWWGETSGSPPPHGGGYMQNMQANSHGGLGYTPASSSFGAGVTAPSNLTDDRHTHTLEARDFGQ